MPGREHRRLVDGWELARVEPDRHGSTTELDQLHWLPARVPGTAAGALGDDSLDGDAHDWWFRVAFDAEPASAEEQVVLALDGLATVCEVYLNGELILASESMFAEHELDVGRLLRGPGNELAIRCRALTPLLVGRRKPRARWRTKLVSSANLRFYRTMLLGRVPGFARGPAVVGPWRPVTLERRSGALLERSRVRAAVDRGAGVVTFEGSVRVLPGSELPGAMTISATRANSFEATELELWEAIDGRARVTGTLTVPEPELWWPHTHGTPARYELSVNGAEGELHHSAVGFRRLRAAANLVADGPALCVNGMPVFVRGTVWTPLSLRDPSEHQLEPVLRTVAEAGLNMLRVPGIGAYEDDRFYELCDELGILVWQDFMFANLDYPESDPAFMVAVENEARAVIDRLAPRPSLAVVCGNSEVAQQVAMVGLDPAIAEGPLYGELLPRIVAEAEVEAPYIPSAPWGGELPFRPGAGVANYYGVGAYLRPLEDARRAEVRFAAESLAFANVPDQEALAEIDAPGGLTIQHPAWKAGVPRDAGAGWDFDDVRDHYLRLLFEVDPVALRYSELDRYLELSRAVTGEVIAEVFGEWRRLASPCRGALVLWCKDLTPGAGWGVLDHCGRPKVAYHHLRRALAPVAVWSTDEGLGGIDAHLANDRSEPLNARLRVALYRAGAQLSEQAELELTLAAHGYARHNVEAMIGRFVDVNWSYRFGPPRQDLVVVSLEDQDGEPISQAFRYPAGRPSTREGAAELGLHGVISRDSDGTWRLTVSSTRFAYGVRVQVPGWVASDDAFGIEPGHRRRLTLRALDEPAALEPPTPSGSLTALNLSGSVRISDQTPR